MPRILLILLALAVAAAGCGREEPVVYDEPASRRCLRESGLEPTTKGLDFVAESALGGAFRTRIGDKKVVVVFGLSDEDAERTELAYRNFAPKGYAVQDVLRRDRNVVVLWSLPPTVTQHERIHGCLREAPEE
jgi:hypothetical protein